MDYRVELPPPLPPVPGSAAHSMKDLETLAPILASCFPFLSLLVSLI